MTPDFFVLPVRRCADVARMVDFFTAVGLVRRDLADDHVDQYGATGRVRLMEAGGGFSPGETYLHLHAGSVEDAVDVADSSDLEYLVWEEEAGQVAGVEGPHGEWMSILDGVGTPIPDEGEPRPGIGVSAIRPSPDFTRDREFFAHFGFDPGPDANPWFEALRGPGSAGTIGLHHAPEGTPVHREAREDVRNRLPLVTIGLTTTEVLEDFADRMVGAGYEARVVEAGGLRKVHVIDPDGVEIEVHPA